MIWDIFWFMLMAFYVIAYIFVVALVIVDLFRDHQLAGGWKALWIVFLVFVPMLTALVYVIARGRGMAERSARRERPGARRPMTTALLHRPTLPATSPRPRSSSTPA